jgi:hypothetical protein
MKNITKYIIIIIIFIFTYRLFLTKKNKLYERFSNFPILETQIYHIGLPKCGTTSTADIFGKHIFAKHDHREEEMIAYVYKYLNNDIDIHTVAKYLKERENINGDIIQFDSNGQFFLFYKELYKLNPNAKYIFTFRNMYDWMNSLYNYQLGRYSNSKTYKKRKLFIILTYNMWNIMFKKMGHLNANRKVAHYYYSKKDNIDDLIGHFWNKRIDSMVAVQCRLITEFIKFAENKKNIIIIPLKNLNSTKTLKKLEIFTGVKGLTKSHSNKNRGYSKNINKRKFIKSFTTYKTPEIIKLYKKYNINN